MEAVEISLAGSSAAANELRGLQLYGGLVAQLLIVNGQGFLAD